eukprot:3918085-Karenia_brevis.AAC.1
MSEDIGDRAARRSSCKTSRRSAEDECQDVQRRHFHHPNHLPQPKTIADLGGGNRRKMKKMPEIRTSHGNVTLTEWISEIRTSHGN